MGWVINDNRGRFTSGKETRYLFIGGWVGPRASVEGCVKERIISGGFRGFGLDSTPQIKYQDIHTVSEI